MRNLIPTRLLLRAAAGALGVVALVAVGGTAAAASGVLTGAPGSPSQGASPSGSSAPSGSASPDRDNGAGYANCAAVRAAGKAPLYRWETGYRLALDSDRDGVACERQDRDSDGSDGSDGKDGKAGKDGKDGTSRTVYVHEYVTRYLDSGGDRSRVKSGGQVAILPSGGVDTGRP